MDQKELEMGVWTKNICFCAIFLAQFWIPPPPYTEIGLQNKISRIGVYHLHLEKSGHFEIIQKIGSHLEKFGQF